MIELILSLLLISTNIAWMIFTHRLINKVMSRNYHEYVQAAPVPPRPEPLTPAEPEVDLGPLSEF